MPNLQIRSIAAAVAAVLLLSPSSSAFQSPLSPESLREAYFLGQRRDESMAHFLEKYTRRFPAPKAGPQISSIALFTPFALAVQKSSQNFYGYSAQQAQLDHRGVRESVKVIVEIRLTDSYGAYTSASPGSGADSNAPVVSVPRAHDFWKSFHVQVLSDDQVIEPRTLSGKRDYSCYRGGCTLIGAIIELDFAADTFPYDSATVQVDPAEGGRVSAEFNLIALK